MRILFINNDGGGFADHIDLPDGQTVQELFAARMPHAKPQNYLIRVNRQAVAPDLVLREGDRVSFTPTKIEGAIRLALLRRRAPRFAQRERRRRFPVDSCSRVAMMRLGETSSAAQIRKSICTVGDFKSLSSCER